MKNIWSKIIKNWPLVVIILALVVLVFWPLLIINGDSDARQFTLRPKLLNQKYSLPVLSPLAASSTIVIPENILVFGGDIMLSRTVNSKMVKYDDYTWPLKNIYPLFKNADLAIANLESPFLLTNNYLVPSGSFSFKADPKSVAALSLAGFDILSLANNHILNQGAAGLEDTQTILDQAGIDYSGVTGHNLTVKDSQGIKFAFLSYTYAPDSKLISAWPSNTQLKDDLLHARQQADVVIVMMHAGTEYKRQPNRQQTDFAHLAIDSGADLVIGHHPHWPQIIEKYQGKMIIYSLGNLVFDQMWSLETRQGLLAKMFWRDGWERIEIIPIKIYDYGQPEIVRYEEERKEILEKIGLPNDGVIKIQKEVITINSEEK